MDHAYAISTLEAFLVRVNNHLSLIAQWESAWEWPKAPDDLLLQEVQARRIENAYKPGLGDYEFTVNEQDHWDAARRAAIGALGRASTADEYAAFLRPTSPSLAADALHPWVWEPAAPLWAAEAHQDAVLAAARTVNRRLQQKLNRHGIGESTLCMQSFDPTSPTEGKPRLRFDGDRDTPTWKARQEGAKYLSAGAFLGIRNLAAHEEQVTWTQQEALEYLATFSVIARWIEECTVEIAT
ncbi:TIGR02391 family protein [Streptomyces prunicolor]|uniref:TIGR02391 family protein n=1 Tax=Streptomyces prunicolor TaxID=67348 RepID=UPI0022551226|nr:TIGR02391 family protein [Streptomyces prunicolor]MCX5234411.1 TIGR02391 family protein [Streptomyces prunicolor]